MSFFNMKITTVALTVSLAGFAMASPTLNEEDMKMIGRSRQVIEQASKMDAPDWLRQYDSEAPLQKTENGVKRWLPEAQRIGDVSSEFVKKAIQEAYEVDAGTEIRTVEMDIRADSPLTEGEELYYFVSFAQPESEIKEILQASSEVDARVILRGMRPEDKMVNQTAYAMAALAKDIKPTPKVSIDPRLHTVFDIIEAPSMVYRKGDHVVSLKGLTTAEWFLNKSRESEGNVDLGKVSDTYEISERDVIEEIQSRVAAVDWDAKRQKAMNRYIEKLPNFNLPTAVKDEVYKIDPRVIFHKDVTAKDGTLLASKGQVVNPMDHFPGQSLTLFIFDGLSGPQRALVKKEIKNASGQIGLMTSRIDKQEGFQYLSDLAKEYGQQVYMLQERMVTRFQLRYLPVSVTLANGEMIVREFGIRAQEDALHEAKEANYQNNETIEAAAVTEAESSEKHNNKG